MLFKKKTEFPQHPPSLTKKEILEDLQVTEDPVFSDSVKRIIFKDGSHKDTNFLNNTETFETVNELMRIKINLDSQVKKLMEQYKESEMARDELTQILQSTKL